MSRCCPKCSGPWGLTFCRAPVRLNKLNTPKPGVQTRRWSWLRVNFTMTTMSTAIDLANSPPTVRLNLATAGRHPTRRISSTSTTRRRQEALSPPTTTAGEGSSSVRHWWCHSESALESSSWCLYSPWWAQSLWGIVVVVGIVVSRLIARRPRRSEIFFYHFSPCV